MKRNSGGVNFPWLSSLTVGGILIFNANQVLAQVTPDNTLGDESSVVNPRDDNSDSIDGGALRGSNLFHSFQEFNVGENRGVYFSNPDAVNNIFSRVTGENVSNILGTLGVDGAANLYLINPNGIVFGENASLDVQGSFTATTADVIEFGEGGLFSAVEPGESLLTISVPLGLQFGSTPGSIVNQSFVQDETGESVGLQVPTGENLTLVGGEVRFEAGEATARGGNINIGGLGAAGTVGIYDDDSLSFPEDVERADITFSNAADVDVRGAGGGNINVNAGNLRIEAGEFGSSQIRAGITADSTSAESQAGNITFNATDKIQINDSLVSNQVDLEAVGNAGNIFINTGSLSLNGDEGLVDTRTYGQGNAGNIAFDVLENIEIVDGSILSEVGVANPQAEGNAGDVSIKAQNLILQDGGKISSSTFGKGNPGDINIDVSEALTLSNNGYISSQIRFNSAVTENFTRSSIDINAGSLSIIAPAFSIVTPSEMNTATFGQGNAGDINIDVSGDINIVSGNISSEIGSPGIGNAGNITINANSLSLENGASLDSRTDGVGNPGNINIDVNEVVTLSNSSDIFGMVYNNAKVNENFTRNTININANSLAIVDSENETFTSQINTSTYAQANAGDINLNVEGSLKITKGRILSNVESGAEGNGGSITIDANSLSLQQGGQIRTSVKKVSFSDLVGGQGDAGNISLNTESLEVDNSAIFSGVESGSIGNGGDLTINTDRLIVQRGGFIATSVLSNSNGIGGNLTVNALESVEIVGTTADGNFASGLSTETQSSGAAGNLQISTKRLSVIDGGSVNANTSGSGRGGNLTINSFEKVEILDGSSAGQFSSSISADARSSGNAGDIIIETKDLVAEGGGFIGSVAREGSSGNAGNITINASDSIELIGLVPERNRFSGISAAVFPNGSGNGGNLLVETQRLTIRDGAGIFVSNLGSGQAGTLTVKATDSIEMFGTSGGGDLNVASGFDATGKGGNLIIETGRLSIRDGSKVLLNTLGKADAGRIEIKASDSIEITGISLDTQLPSQIDASSGLVPDLIDDSLVQLTPGFTGQGGDIVIQANSLTLSDEAQINAAASGTGDAGNISIDVSEFLDVTDGNISTETLQSSGGAINIIAKDIRLRRNSDIRTDVDSGINDGGDITLTADSILTFDDSDIFAFAADGQGGNITLNTPAFFAENFTLNSLTAENTELLENNNRADVNATGAVSSGAVSIPDVSFIQNSLTELPDNSLNTDELVANSCVLPAGERNQGKFIISGGDGLPVRPGGNLPSKYPTGEVRGASEDKSVWHPGDPIVEPQGVYRLANGKLVLSRECN